jgi:hypothetical protein
MVRRDNVALAMLSTTLLAWILTGTPEAEQQYSGTVFGAVSGAHKYNRDVRQEALGALRARYDDHPESWPPGNSGR